MRVLIVDDDKPLLAFLRNCLEAQNYSVQVASDAEEARNLGARNSYDLAIIDWNLPGGDGLEVLKQLRARNTLLPALILTSRREVEDRVRALDLGADDYLPKPFALSELSARVRALLRRSARTVEAVLRVGDLQLNRVQRTVTRAGRLIDLTGKELALLEYLMLNAGTCVTRSMIIEHVWKLSSETTTNVVDVYINYLRKKVDGESELKLIHTIRGAGYQLGGTIDERVKAQGAGTT